MLHIENVKKGMLRQFRFLKNKLFILLLLLTVTGYRQQDVDHYIDLYNYANSLNLECKSSLQEFTDEQLCCFVYTLRRVNSLFDICIENKEFVYNCINDMISNVGLQAREFTLRNMVVGTQTCGIYRATSSYKNNLRY